MEKAADCTAVGFFVLQVFLKEQHNYFEVSFLKPNTFVAEPLLILTNYFSGDT